MRVVQTVAASTGLLLIMALGGGCLGGGDSAGADESTSAGSSSAPPGRGDGTSAGIDGVVTDDAQLPIEGALVAILGTELSTLSDAQGKFSFSGVTPGKAILQVQKLGYEGTARSVELTAGEVASVRLTLIPISTQDPYYKSQTKAAFIGCSVDARQGGSNASLVTFAVCGLVYYAPQGSAVDRFRLDWNVEVNNTGGLVVESAWTSTQPTGAGLYIWWVSYKDGTLISFAGIKGKSPARAEIDGPSFKKDYGRGACPQVVENTPPCQLTSFHYTHATTPGESYPVNAGVTVQQKIDDYVTAFYFGPPPPGFSVLPPT